MHTFYFILSLVAYRVEMVDKLEPPSIPDGYALTLGFACLLDICRSVELNILVSPNSEATPHNQTQEHSVAPENRKLHESLVSSSWGGLLASFTLLLDAR